MTASHDGRGHDPAGRSARRRRVAAFDAEVSSTSMIAAGRLRVFAKLDNLTDATGRRLTAPLKE